MTRRNGNLPAGVALSPSFLLEVTPPRPITQRAWVVFQDKVSGGRTMISITASIPYLVILLQALARQIDSIGLVVSGRGRPDESGTIVIL